MSNFELEIQKLKDKIAILEREHNNIPNYSFSKISFEDLDNLFDINKKIDKTKFSNWFDNNLDLLESDNIFLKNLIDENIDLISSYNEEELKINLISPILNKIKFKSIELEFRDFYELQLKYETDKFILKGSTDFVVANGIFQAKKPLFFIQEFKKSRDFADPEPQLVAELISGVELNQWKNIKGAYIIGQNWNFVILEKIEDSKYKYFVSKTFNSTNFDELKDIYKNLLFIKHEIIEKLKLKINEI
jgi:hypothetical protein